MTTPHPQENWIKEFDDKYLNAVLTAYPEYQESHNILLSDIKSFIRTHKALWEQEARREVIEEVNRQLHYFSVVAPENQRAATYTPEQFISALRSLESKDTDKPQ